MTLTIHVTRFTLGSKSKEHGVQTHPFMNVPVQPRTESSVSHIRQSIALSSFKTAKHTVGQWCHIGTAFDLSYCGLTDPSVNSLGPIFLHSPPIGSSHGFGAPFGWECNVNTPQAPYTSYVTARNRGAILYDIQITRWWSFVPRDAGKMVRSFEMISWCGNL